MRVLGISAFYHDSAAALVEGGRITAAAQEERFTRRKHEAGFPGEAIAFCLEQAGVSLPDVDRVAFYDKPFLKFERLLETYVAFAPRGFRSFAMALPLWLKEKLFQKHLLCRLLGDVAPDVDWSRRLLFAEHHQSHAASAFYPSPFREAAVLTLDGVGEWATTSAAAGRGNDLDMLTEIRFPHSLGLLYSAFTYHAGFRVNSGEYKLMGLASYGEPTYANVILDNLIDVKPDGSFRLDLSYFDYCTGLKMTNRRFDDLFGAPPRAPGEPFARRHMNMAASIQAVLEEVVLRLTRSLRADTAMSNLCLAGGVALNCVANGKVLRDGRFEGIWIQPAAGDAGGALGAALLAGHRLFGEPRPSTARQDGGAAAGGRVRDAMAGAFLGPEFGDAEIRRALSDAGTGYCELADDALIGAAADALAAGEVVGWFQGRMEFGPRALGNRSILGDARSPTMQSTLNLKIKGRESFRPFAPSVPRSQVSDWFDLDCDSPYMLVVADVIRRRRQPRSDAVRSDTPATTHVDSPPPESRLLPRLRTHSEIPAVTHVDGSARVHTVDPETNPRFHALLRAFEARTGCPVIVNTSFNVNEEPIVCTPAEALRCFMRTDMDCLAIGNFWLRKDELDSDTPDTPDTTGSDTWIR